MFFEDEKDIIKEGTEIQISDDGTVTWEDVLDSDDDLVIESQASNAKNSAQSKESTVDIGDELELVQDTNEDVNEQDLMKILSEEEGNRQASNDSSFDIDSQLANVVLEQNGQGQTQDIGLENDNIIPRKKTKKKTSSSSPVLVAFLFACIIVGAIYYGYTYMKDMNYNGGNINEEELIPPASPQQEMNNINQEELQERQEANIPVVNEEEAQEVKPEEKPKEEKKQVIHVVPTGRSNPFMPISKYAKSSIPEANVVYDQIGIPRPPEKFGAQEEATTKLMTIAVSGIMYDETKPSAIITLDETDYFVQKGDRLDKYKILEITRNSVTIAYGNNIYKANIGEEFKISSKFYGSAQYIPQTQGGGKQYYTAQMQEQMQEANKQKDSRYVSENEIEINTRY